MYTVLYWEGRGKGGKEGEKGRGRGGGKGVRCACDEGDGSKDHFGPAMAVLHKLYFFMMG